MDILNISKFEVLKVESSDFKLYINTENGLIEVKNFELNIKDGYLALN